MKTSMRGAAWLACALLWLAGVIVSLPAAAASYDVSLVIYPASYMTGVFGINEQGMVVGTAFYGGSPSTAYVYNPRKDTFVPLPSEPGYETWGIGINEAGVVVGHITKLDPDPTKVFTEAFIYDKGVLTRLSYPGAAYTEARGINNRGLVAGNAKVNGVWWGLIYNTVTGAVVAFVPSLDETIAQGINDRGDVVGSVWLRDGEAYENSPADFYGFVRDARGVVTLFRVNGQRTVARGISSDGRITGWAGRSTEPQGFIIDAPTGGGFKDLTVDDLYPGFQGQGITNKGKVVGNVWLDEGGEYPALRGFIATPIH